MYALLQYGLWNYIHGTIYGNVKNIDNTYWFFETDWFPWWKTDFPSEPPIFNFFSTD